MDCNNKNINTFPCIMLGRLVCRANDQKKKSKTRIKNKMKTCEKKAISLYWQRLLIISL